MPRFTLPLSVCLLFACDSTSHTLDASTDAGAAPLDDAGPRHDPDAGDPGSDGGPPGDCSTPRRGYAEFMATEHGPVAIAAFWRGTDCMREVSGPCAFIDCADTPDRERAYAGIVEVFGDLGHETFEFRGSNGLYMALSRSDATWVVGGRAGVRAFGTGEFPPFEQSVTLPGPIDVLTGPPDPITSGFEVSWTPNAASTVTIYVIDPDGPSIVCTYPGSSGSGSLPTDLLSRFGAVSANVVVATIENEVLCQSDRTIEVAATNRVVDRFVSLDVR